MSQHEQRDMSGVLFFERNVVGDRPQMKGNLTVNGRNFKIVAWKRKSSNGNPYLSIAVDDGSWKNRGGGNQGFQNPGRPSQQQPQPQENGGGDSGDDFPW